MEGFWGGPGSALRGPGAFTEFGGPGGVLGGSPRALGVSWDVVGPLGASWGVSVASWGLLGVLGGVLVRLGRQSRAKRGLGQGLWEDLREILGDLRGAFPRGSGGKGDL